MNSLPLSTIIVASQLAHRELASALPDAPVVAHQERRTPRLPRTRRATAAVLVRAAHRLAPA